MKIETFYRLQSLFLAGAFLFLFPTISLAEKIFGGLTFLGDRQGICIEIAGECATEDIDFELATCDANNSEKEKFKKRMPFRKAMIPRYKFANPLVIDWPRPGLEDSSTSGVSDGD